GRDGCRVPLPWSADAPAYGFSPTGRSWLPQPEVFGELAADVQEGVEGSTLVMYRAALHLRAELGLGRPDGGVSFLEDLPAGVLGASRGTVTVLVHTTDTAVDQPQGPRDDADVLVASPPLAPSALPADAAVWLRTA